MASFAPCLALAAAVAGLAGPARGEAIYSYTGPDGAVHLSNVPADARYAAIVSDGGTAPAAAQPARAPALAGKSRFDRLVGEIARGHGLDSALLHAVISVESRYNPNALSPRGAGGLMQLTPDTAKRFGVADVFDPMQNLQGGARYLRHLLRLFNSDLRLTLAAYNAGENAVARYDMKIPPFRETMEYVPKVLSYYTKYRSTAVHGGEPTAVSSLPRADYRFPQARGG